MVDFDESLKKIKDDPENKLLYLFKPTKRKIKATFIFILSAVAVLIIAGSIVNLSFLKIIHPLANFVIIPILIILVFLSFLFYKLVGFFSLNAADHMIRIEEDLFFTIYQPEGIIGSIIFMIFLLLIIYIFVCINVYFKKDTKESDIE